MIRSKSLSVSIAGVFYNVKKRIVIYYIKKFVKNLSNENKQWCFCCLMNEWIKMPILWKHLSFTEILWRTFWRNKWRSIFDVVKDSSWRLLNGFSINDISYRSKTIVLLIIEIKQTKIIVGSWKVQKQQTKFGGLWGAARSLKMSRNMHLIFFIYFLGL